MRSDEDSLYGEGGLFFMLRRNKALFFLLGIAASLVVLAGFGRIATQASAQELVRVIPHFGTGTHEILIFSDYFCPHCKIIDEKAEGLLKELLATHKVQIKFIDVPFNRATPIYAKYYLQAVNAQPDLDNALRVRKALFEAAMDKGIRDEEALTRYLAGRQIKWTAMNEKSVFPLMGALIKEHKINQTPTCLIRYSAVDMRRYIGSVEIWNGLQELKNHLSAAVKKRVKIKIATVTQGAKAHTGHGATVTKMFPPGKARRESALMTVWSGTCRQAKWSAPRMRV